MSPLKQHSIKWLYAITSIEFKGNNFFTSAPGSDTKHKFLGEKETMSGLSLPFSLCVYGWGAWEHVYAYICV